MKIISYRQNIMYLAACCCSDFSLYSLQMLHLSSSYLYPHIVADQESNNYYTASALANFRIDKIASYLELVLKSSGSRAWIMLCAKLIYHLSDVIGCNFCLSAQYVLVKSIVNEYVLALITLEF